MMLGFHATKKDILRITAVFVVAVSASACSSLPSMPSVPDWVDPTTWFGDDTPAATNDSGQTPDLANLPDKPAASTPDEQKEVAKSLAGDRSNAKYSADALRGGTEPAAAPPPAGPVQVASASETLPMAASGSDSQRRHSNPRGTTPHRAGRSIGSSSTRGQFDTRDSAFFRLRNARGKPPRAGARTRGRDSSSWYATGGSADAGGASTGGVDCAFRRRAWLQTFHRAAARPVAFAVRRTAAFSSIISGPRQRRAFRPRAPS